MANPFLFTEEVGNSHINNTNSSFNPFLAGNDFQDTSANENPFMSNYESQISENVFDSGATNPFAFGTEAQETNTDFFSMHSTKVEDTINSDINYENIFSTTTAQVPETKKMDIFGTTMATEEVQPQTFMHDDFIATRDSPPREVTAADIFSTSIDGSDFAAKEVPPRRPPPPRPGPPKETKDLILSVTGAMEATSSHLLDRLQATRTPSPTPMRDLHSPSPTQFGDLLEVDEPAAPPPSAVAEDVNFLGEEFDFQPPVPPVIEPVVTEKRPSIPERSVSPVTPVKPTNEITYPLSTVAKTVTSPPTRPTPPIVPERPRAPPYPPRPPVPVPIGAAPSPKVEPLPVQSQDTCFADVFGDDLLNAKNIAANEPLPSAVQQTIIPSVTSDNFGATFIDSIPQKQSDDTFSNENDLSNAALSESDRFTIFSDNKNNTELISESNTFAEAENFNVQPFTDTSATFSDLSSSNALHDTETIAPFGHFEATITNDFPQDTEEAETTAQQGYNIFDALPQKKTDLNASAASQDDFDAFTAKFESVAFGDVIPGAKAVTSTDPFDPFASAFSAPPITGEYLSF